MIGLIFLAVLARSEPPVLPASLDQDQLNAISSRCASPRRWLVKKRDGSVRLRPSRKADYKKVDCVLAALVPPGSRRVFIGNETFLEPKKPD